MHTYLTVVSGIELPLGLYAECNIKVFYYRDKGERETRLSPGIEPHLVIEEVEITGITIEDEDGTVVKLPTEVLRDEIFPVIDKYLQKNEEELLEEIKE